MFSSYGSPLLIHLSQLSVIDLDNESSWTKLDKGEPKLLNPLQQSLFYQNLFCRQYGSFHYFPAALRIGDSMAISLAILSRLPIQFSPDSLPHTRFL